MLRAFVSEVRSKTVTGERKGEGISELVSEIDMNSGGKLVASGGRVNNVKMVAFSCG